MTFPSFNLYRLLLLPLLASAIVSRASSTDIVVGSPSPIKILSLGAELDPHFFSQNVTRADGVKASDWDSVIVRRIQSLKLKSLRMMVLPQWFEPVNDNDNPFTTDTSRLTFNSPEMQSLYKQLDMAQKLGIHVNLTLWGAHISHFLSGHNRGNWVVAPYDYQEWAENFSILIRHLLLTKHYTCIREITPVNEPDWSFIIDGKRAPVSEYIEMCRILDQRFRADNIRHLVRFSLSDNSDGGSGTHEFLAACTRHLGQEADIFNSHTYLFGYETPDSVIFKWEKANVSLAQSVGKLHFIGEFGSNQCLGATRQADINRFERGILMARIIINCLNAGAAGLSYWSLIDQYYGKDEGYDAMQQLGLWKSVRKMYQGDSLYQHLITDYEVRPQYHAYALLTTHINEGAEVYPLTTDNDFCAATAIKNPDGHWVYAFANGSETDMDIRIKNPYAVQKNRFKVYSYTRHSLPANDALIAPHTKSIKPTSSLRYRIPANSVILLVQE